MVLSAPALSLSEIRRLEESVGEKLFLIFNDVYCLQSLGREAIGAYLA